jgi:hypothetical protein
MVNRFFMALVALWACGPSLRAAPASPAAAPEADMVWSASAPLNRQQFVAFRKRFEIQRPPSSASLNIFADSRYLLWIDGQYVARGPCRFNPSHPRYDSFDVTRYLHVGDNSIVVLVHHALGMQCARIMDHAPGLWARLQVQSPGASPMQIVSDASWRTNDHTEWQPAKPAYSSIADNIDARLDRGDWTQTTFDDADWAPAVAVDRGKWGPLEPRSIPLLVETPVSPLTVIAADKTLQPLESLLPRTLRAGDRLIVDCGHAVQAYSTLKFTADDGARLTLGHPIFLQYPMRTCFYTARQGEQTWMSGDTFGCRYFDLRVVSGSITLTSFQVVQRLYPFQKQGDFQCSDPDLNAIWKMCVNTVQGCSEDTYEDCMDRERAEWMADGYVDSYPVSRIALATPDPDGQWVFADQRLLGNMILHVALTQLPDGRLQPMPPSFYPAAELHGVIDDYSCLWVQAVREYYDRGGDETLARHVWPTLVKSLDYFLNRRGTDGLTSAMEFVYFHNPLIYHVCQGATINAYLYRSLRDAAYLGTALGDAQAAKRFSDAADRLYAGYNQQLWDESVGGYHACSPAGLQDAGTINAKWAERANPHLADPQAPTAHAALMALNFGLVPPDRIQRVLNFLEKNVEAEQLFPYTHAFYFRTLLRDGDEADDRLILDTIRRKWRPMLDSSSGMAWEDFHGGSPVHESGAIPAWVLSAGVLGVQTEGTRGRLQLIIEPHLGDLSTAAGTVLCEYGPVRVSWKTSSDHRQLDFSLDIPAGAPPATVHVPRLNGATSIQVDGKPYDDSNDNSKVNLTGNSKDDGGSNAARYFVLSLTPGQHTGLER